MMKLGILATAGLMSLTAVTATLGTTGDAEARHRRHHSRDVLAGAAIGVLGGVLLGQALAPQPSYGYPSYSPPPAYYPPAPSYYPAPRTYYDEPPAYVQPRRIYVRPRVVYDDPAPVYRNRHHRGQDAHVAWCSARYRSYSPYDNTWVAYSGQVRECVSPYSY